MGCRLSRVIAAWRKGNRHGDGDRDRDTVTSLEKEWFQEGWDELHNNYTRAKDGRSAT